VALMLSQRHAVLRCTMLFHQPQQRVEKSHAAFPNCEALSSS
jgi:hypothetical protein